MDQRYPFPTFPLPYSYVSLLPCCDADTLYAHYKHYSQAVRRLNHQVVQNGLLEKTMGEILYGELNLPPVVEGKIKDLAGLIYNHHFYFDGINAEAAPPPENALTEEIKATYGSMEQLKELMSESAASLQGSGWLWLILEGGGLHLALTPNNETVSLKAVTPILAIDLWEHAYFPIHRFDQKAYLNDWFGRVDWAGAEKKYLQGQESLQN